MKKILNLMLFFVAISRLDAMSDNGAELKEDSSMHVPQSRGWTNDTINRRFGDDDFLSSEELVELNEQYRQRRLGSDNMKDDEANKDTLVYQVEESKNSEEQAQLGLLAQWQRFFMEIVAYFCGK